MLIGTVGLAIKKCRHNLYPQRTDGLVEKQESHHGATQMGTVVVWMRMLPRRLGCMNTWSPVVGAVWVDLPEEG